MSQRKTFDGPTHDIDLWARLIALGFLNTSRIPRSVLPVRDPYLGHHGFGEEDYAEMWEWFLDDLDIGAEDLRWREGFFYNLDLKGHLKFVDNEGAFRLPRYRTSPTQNAGPETHRSDVGFTFATLDTERAFIFLEDDDQEIIAGGLEQSLENKFFSDGRPWFDIRAFGAAVNGTTDDTAAWLAVLAAIPANGGIIFCPGHSVTNVQIALPNRTWLVGLNSFTSRVIAGSSFPSHTPLIRLGTGTGIVFNVRVYRCGLDCSSVGASTGIYSNEIQEQSGVFSVDVNKYTLYGINFETAGFPNPTGASLVGIEHILCFGSPSGSLGGVRFASIAGQAYIRDITVNPSGGTGYADGILVEGGDVHIYKAHIEQHIDGIHYTDGSTGSIKHVYGHVPAGSITNLIHLGVGCSVTLEDINAAGSDGNILVDDHRSITIPVSQMGFISFYTNFELLIGPLSIVSITQSALVDAVIPDLAGVNDIFIMQKLAQQIQYKEFFQCSVWNQTPGYFVSISGTNVMETVRAIPLGTVVGTTDAQTLQQKTFAEHASFGANVVMKFRDAAGDHQYDHVVSDLVASRQVLWPVLDQSPSTLVFLQQAGQTFTADPPFAVTGTSLVTNFNADMVDGLHATDIIKTPCGQISNSGTGTNINLYNSDNVVDWDQNDFLYTSGVQFNHSTVTNNSRFTVLEAGVYEISVKVCYTTEVDNYNGIIRVRKNGNNLTVLDPRGMAGYVYGQA